MRKLLAVLCFASACSLAFAANSSAVTKAYVDDKGTVHIVTDDGQDHAIQSEKGQEKGKGGVEKIQIAPDGKAVGWLVNLWASCCVSYAIPFELIVWQSGHVVRRVHPGMAIWSWAFIGNGKELAYRSRPLHGGWSGECTLVDVATGKELGSWDHPVDENGNDTDESDESSGKPDWAKQVP